MKAMQGILLLAVMLVVSCSEEPGKKDPIQKTPTEVFLDAINEKHIWDSDGSELVASINEDKEGALGDVYIFNSLVLDKFSTQAIYELKFGNGFIGIELFDGNKQAVMYKKGTVEDWDSLAEVSFAPEHKLVSSAKGEWIADAKDKTIRIDSIEYTMKNDGHLYLEATEDVLTFTHISTTQPVTRTPDDGFLRDRAIYQKGNAEFLGLLSDDTDKLLVYKNATDPTAIAFWATEGDVDFINANKISPDQAFLENSKGTYNNILVLAPTVLDPTKDEYKLADIVIDEAGVLLNAEQFTFDSALPADETSGLVEKAIYKFGSEFVGIEVSDNPKTLKIYINNGKEYWTGAGDVEFDPKHYISILNAYINDLKLVTTHVLGESIYTLKDNGDLHLKEGDVLAFTYVKHLQNTEGVFVRSKMAYKTTDNKYVGIEHDVVRVRIHLYKDAKTSAWANEVDITDAIFTDANKVVAVGTWDPLGDIVADIGNISACHLSTTLDPDGNVFVLFRDRTTTYDNHAQVIKYDITSKEWSFVGVRGELDAGPVNEVAIKSDSFGNLYASYYKYSANEISIRKFAVGGTEWVDFGEDGAKIGSEGSGPALVIGMDSGTEYIYALVKVSGDIVAKRRKTDGSDTWTLVGGVIFDENLAGLAGSSIVLKSDGTPVVAIGGLGKPAAQYPYDLRVAEWNGAAWIELGSPTDIGKSSDMSVNVNSKDEIYVAYRDQTTASTSGDEGRGTIKKWNGSTWELVGTRRGLSENLAEWIRIRFYNDDIPLVIYGGDGGSASPTRGYYYKEDSNEWVKLGSSAFISAGLTFYTDGVVNPVNDKFYVAYRETTGGNLLRVSVHERVVPR